MKISIAIAAAAVLLSVSTIGQAATVGYKGGCYGQPDSYAAHISAAGHTPIALGTIDATTLAPLNALVYEAGCSPQHSAADLEAAVANGLTLILHWSPNISVPGGAGLIRMDRYPGDALLPINSPLLSGPGGNLSQTSLVGSLPQGITTLASLPTGSSVLATAANDPADVVAFTYSFGRGRVVYSSIPLSCFLTGYCYSTASAVQTYAINLLAWAVPSFVSCASEGYSGTKLTLCRQVCEIEQTPSRLLSLIRLYKTAYREDPPCAR